MSELVYYNDKGCQIATEYLGVQSTCLNCPFNECVEDGRFSRYKIRNKEIVQKLKNGRSQKELAKEYSLSLHSIGRIKKEGENG